MALIDGQTYWKDNYIMCYISKEKKDIHFHYPTKHLAILSWYPKIAAKDEDGNTECFKFTFNYN